MLAIASAVYLGALEAAQTGWHKLWKALGIALLLWGAFLLIAAASGGNSSLQPLSHLVGKGTGVSGETSAASSHGSFRKVASSDELDALLAEAKASNTPVMFDFYADWCVSCKEMESFTFADPQVAQRMKSLRLVQVDMTDNTDAHKALLKRFGLVGPPAILFFNAQGEEQKALRVVGFMKADKFLQQLDKVVLRK
jgi:thiol:disulfide interchange protein DsbD